MSEQRVTAAGGGTSIIGLLGVLFVGLKLTGFINWSWWWVLAPFWGGLVIFGVSVAFLLGIAFFAAMFRK